MLVATMRYFQAKVYFESRQRRNKNQSQYVHVPSISITGSFNICGENSLRVVNFLMLTKLASENEIEIQAVVVYIQNPQDHLISFIMLCLVLYCFPVYKVSSPGQAVHQKFALNLNSWLLRSFLDIYIQFFGAGTVNQYWYKL